MKKDLNAELQKLYGNSAGQNIGKKVDKSDLVRSELMELFDKDPKDVYANGDYYEPKFRREGSTTSLPEDVVIEDVEIQTDRFANKLPDTPKGEVILVGRGKKRKR